MTLLKASWDRVRLPQKEEPARSDYMNLSHEDLVRLIDFLKDRIGDLNDRMLGKKEVAERVGMTVSWLDNSQSDKAIRLRSTGIRYGNSQTSPVRFPLSAVMNICLEGKRNRSQR